MQHVKRRMPYSIGSEKLEKLDDEDIKNNLSEDEERKLSTDMRELYDRLLPTAESNMRRGKLVEKLEKLFNDEWPGHDIRVHVFGSSGNLLCTDQSDGKQIWCMLILHILILGLQLIYVSQLIGRNWKAFA